MSSSPIGVQPEVFASPNFFTDAARIYISQKTDIDANFGLAPGRVGMKKSSSGIGVKADEVRIIGRTGIKFITGKAQNVDAGADGEKTAHGNVIQTVGSIDFIAGNDSTRPIGGVDKLQPLVKGENLIACLQAMAKRINDLATIVDNMHRTQHQFNKLLAAHTHIVVSPGAPTGPSFVVNAGYLKKSAQDMGKVTTPMAAFKIGEYFDLESEFFTTSGKRYICSRHVNTT